MEVISKSQVEKPTVEQDVWFNFINSLKSPITKETYSTHIKYYLKFCGFNNLSEFLTTQEPDKQIIKYIMSLRQKGLSSNSIHTMLYAIYHLYEMNPLSNPPT